MMDQAAVSLIEALFDAFNRRDIEGALALCDPDIEFLPVTAQFANQGKPYVGHEGIRRYLQDVEEIWEELTVRAFEFRPAEGGQVLVLGRVVARSKERGVRDLPAAWIWRISEGKASYGRAFEDPREGSAEANQI